MDLTKDNSQICSRNFSNNNFYEKFDGNRNMKIAIGKMKNVKIKKISQKWKEKTKKKN